MYTRYGATIEICFKLPSNTSNPILFQYRKVQHSIARGRKGDYFSPSSELFLTDSQQQFGFPKISSLSVSNRTMSLHSHPTSADSDEQDNETLLANNATFLGGDSFRTYCLCMFEITRRCVGKGVRCELFVSTSRRWIMSWLLFAAVFA